jgi:hypothetical protein
MASAATQAARAGTAPAPARRAPARRRGSPRPRTARPRRPRTSRPYAGTPMPARLVPIAVGRTAGAVSGLAESGFVHRLTRGRLWIGVLTGLLVGIVALNVMALSINASSSRATRQAEVLNRQISTLRAQVATNGVSNQRVTSEASKLGMVVPQPDAIGYVTASHQDAQAAAKRLESGEVAAGSVTTDAATAPVTSTTDPALTTVPATTTP